MKDYFRIPDAIVGKRPPTILSGDRQARDIPRSIARYTVKHGWFFVHGDLDDSKVTRALYVASLVLAKRTAAERTDDAIRNYNALLTRQATGAAAPLLLEPNNRRRLRALAEQKVRLLWELSALARLFSEWGDDVTVWSGHFGDGTFTSGGKGLEGAISIAHEFRHLGGWQDAAIDAAMTILASALLDRFAAGIGLKFIGASPRRAAPKASLTLSTECEPDRSNLSQPARP